MIQTAHPQQMVRDLSYRATRPSWKNGRFLWLGPTWRIPVGTWLGSHELPFGRGTLPYLGVLSKHGYYNHLLTGMILQAGSQDLLSSYKNEHIWRINTLNGCSLFAKGTLRDRVAQIGGMWRSVVKHGLINGIGSLVGKNAGGKAWYQFFHTIDAATLLPG